jgi:hypothetical protein
MEFSCESNGRPTDQWLLIKKFEKVIERIDVPSNSDVRISPQERPERVRALFVVHPRY